MVKQKIAVLTGAGVSAESGLDTFRGKGGLWEGHRVTDVASPEGWMRDPGMVLEFYNQRRRQLKNAEPNQAHLDLASMEDEFEVDIITQNIVNLHERAGSSQVLHLHGEIVKARSSQNEDEIIEIGYRDLNVGDMCSRGYQLRPHIVWFGEAVPAMELAIYKVMEADVLAVIGTSLEVYPAASLLHYLPKGRPIFLIDPGKPSVPFELGGRVTHIAKPATIGVRHWKMSIKKGPTD